VFLHVFFVEEILFIRAVIIPDYHTAKERVAYLHKEQLLHSTHHKDRATMNDRYLPVVFFIYPDMSFAERWSTATTADARPSTHLTMNENACWFLRGAQRLPLTLDSGHSTLDTSTEEVSI